MSSADYEQYFNDLDTDGSGSVSLDELVSGLKRKGYRGSDADIKRVFKAVDTSGDGTISFSEYMTAMSQTPPEQHKGAWMRRVFNDFDKDGNGTISRCELDQVFKEMGKHFSEAELKRMIELGDKDQSGSLDYNEFIKQVFGKDA